MLKKLILFIFFTLSFSSFAAECDLLSLGAGINNVRRKKKSQSAEFRAEFRFRQKWWIFNPLLGAGITSKEQLYAYGGIALDLILKKKIAFVPGFAAGYYNRGCGKDLGCPLEFRTSAELAFVFKNLTRVGCGISHTSNASIGRKNPGLETLIFFVSFPIRHNCSRKDK